MIKLIALASGAALLLAGCDEKAPGNAQTAATSSAPSQVVKLGAAGRATGVELKVTDVATPKQVGPTGASATAQPGETFVVVAYTLKNTADRALSFMERPALSLRDAAGNTYEPDAMASGMVAVMMDDPSGMSADLNPNVSARTKATWKVDAKAFDRATWKLVLASDPQLTFDLK